MNTTELSSEPTVVEDREHRCLWCRHALESPLRASNTCAACGRINLREDLRIFRTRRFVPRLLEGALKTVAGVLLGALFLLSIGPAMGMGAGYAIGLVLLTGLIVWDALGLITRRRSILVYRIFVPGLLAGCTAPVLILTFLFVATGGPTREWSVPLLVGALVASVAWYLRFGRSRPRTRARRRVLARGAADAHDD